MNFKDLQYVALAIAPIILFVFFMKTGLFGAGLAIPSDSDESADPDANYTSTLLNTYYSLCDGQPVEAKCTDLSCIEPGIESRVFDVWKERFKQIHNLSEKDFNEHIKINDVSYTDSKFQWVRIEYTFEKGWVKSRQNESINLGSVKIDSAEDLNEKQLISDVNLAIEEAEGFDRSVISWQKTQELMKTTYKDKPLAYSFCSIDFLNVSGDLVLEGSSVIDFDNNVCSKSFINLNTGDMDVYDDACFLE